MKPARIMEGVRMMRFRDVFGRHETGALTELEAAELLGVTDRTFRRWVSRFEEAGEAGLRDRRIGKRSARAVPALVAAKVERLYRERYQDFTAKHFLSIWSRIMVSAGATRGRRRFCRSAACCRKRRAAGRIAASGSGGRWLE